MADSNRSRIADYDGFADNDPFAELTRIMGHDPRPLPASSDEDLEIDLENELMGGLADVEGPEDRSAEPVGFASQDESDAVEGELAEAMEAELEAPLDLEDEFASVFEEDFEPEAPEALETTEDSVPEEFASRSYSEEVSFSAQDDGGAGYAEPQAPQYPYEDVASEPAQASDELPDIDFGDEDLAVVDSDFGSAAGGDYELAEAREPVAQHEEPFENIDWSSTVAVESSSADEVVGTAEWNDASAQAQDEAEEAFLSAMADDGAAEEPVAEVDWQQEAIDGGSDFGATEPVEFAAGNSAIGQDTPVKASFSDEHRDLEGELAALLSEQEAGSAALAQISLADTAEESAPEAEEAFDYSLAASDRHDFLSEEAVEEPSEVEFDLPDDFAELGEDDFAETASQPAAETDVDDEPAPYIHLSSPSDPYHSEAGLEPGSADTDSNQPELDEMTFADAIEPVEETVQASYAAAVASGAVTAHMPEIETVEVPDQAVAMADDLDIPELDLEEDVPPASEFDELEAELAGAFGEIPLETVAAASAAPEAAASLMAEQGGTAAEHQIDPVQDERAYLSEPELAASYAAAVTGYHGSAAAVAEDDLEFDRTGFDGMASVDAHDHPDQEKPSRRGLLIAAAVAGVAVIGGIGAYAFSFGDSGSSTPAVVEASDEPFKVRPENPGGTKVANQNNEVYRRASGISSDERPAQERLVTTTEEPIDVAARTETQPRLADASAETEGNDIMASTQDAVAKSDDRLDPAVEDTGMGKVVTVTPHKVRTLVVRPDGTMVPTEAPAQTTGEELVASADDESAVEAMRQPSASDANAAPNAPSIGAANNENPLAEAAPVPTSRPARTPVAQQPRQEEPQQQPQQVASAATTGATAGAAAPVTSAPASKWSVQISSQPTAESAQQSYQDLARRYGDLLSGRGVNIVKADIAGKGTYYRVRVPSSSKDDAIDLCSRLKAAGGSCFVSQ
ncbi:MAG TPA: SPOR domain-containing protein [Rhizobiaceae bacterium]|nr:SPOR domain-containing protein [Rhizobiaceae bacterium]